MSIETTEQTEERNQQEFSGLVSESESNLLGTCPLVEDEAIAWAGRHIGELEKRLEIPGSIKTKLSKDEFAISEINELLKFSQHEACPDNMIISRGNLSNLYHYVTSLEDK